jgi:glyoxylase-like metal-dependent hydrolase (beta-lactamase superfamily II)
VPVGHDHLVAAIEVTPVLDAAGPFTLGSLADTFPGADAADWDAARDLDPAAFTADGSWFLPFHCFLVRTDHRLLLVDTGVGPAGSAAASWAPLGRLPEALAEAGVTPADVDVVVHTHLHSDHVGWSVVAGVPVFPDARYVVQQAELDALTGAGSPLLDSLVAPLQDADRLDAVTGAATLAPGVVTLPTPGHTAGHQSVVVDTGGRRTVVTGDAFVHAVQLVAPEVGYAFETDGRQAVASRRLLLERRDAGDRLAVSHLNRAFVPGQES